MCEHFFNCCMSVLCDVCLPPQFSRLVTQGPASFYVFCVVVCAFCMYLGGVSGCCFSSLSIMSSIARML